MINSIFALGSALLMAALWFAVCGLTVFSLSAYLEGPRGWTFAWLATLILFGVTMGWAFWVNARRLNLESWRDASRRDQKFHEGLSSLPHPTTSFYGSDPLSQILLIRLLLFVPSVSAGMFFSVFQTVKDPPTEE